jgi:penicillin-binding protein-related factor A (putative recombinase)
MTRDNAAIGRAAQAVGSNFEAYLHGQHDVAKMTGILAHIAHNQAQASVVRGRLIYTAAGVSDYTGTLDRSGISVAVEAKSTKAESLPRAAVKPKQQEHLEVVARAGGLALLLVEFRITELPLHYRFAVPWLEVPWVTKRSAESISAEQLGPWLIAPGTCYLERFHQRGTPTSLRRGRVYARE